MSEKKQYKFTFTISEEMDARIKALPRSVKLSGKMRMALVQVLYDLNGAAPTQPGAPNEAQVQTSAPVHQENAT